MVTGKHPFAGDCEQAVVYSILNEEPEPLTALRTGVPLAVESIVEKCLRKDAKHRYQSAAGVIADLEAVKSGSGSTSRTGVRASAISVAPSEIHPKISSGSAWIWAAALAKTAVSAALLGRLTSPRPEAPLTEFVISERPIPQGFDLSFPRIAPNGEVVALPLNNQIYLRQLSSEQIRPIPGTEGGQAFFWSPDSRFLGFHREGSIWKIDISGGLPQQLAVLPAGFPWAGTWTEEGIIYANIARGPGRGELHRIPDRGGVAVKVIPSDTTLQSGALLLPEAIRGTGDILFTWLSEDDITTFGTYRLSGDDVTLVSREHYMYGMQLDSEGYLLYGGNDAHMWTVPYDKENAQPTGEPVLVIRDVNSGSVSENGSLVYTRINPGSSQFGWVDFEGRKLSESGGSRALSVLPRMSSDGSFYLFMARPAVSDVSSAEITNAQLFIHRIAEGTEQILTEKRGTIVGFSLSPDDQQIALSYDWDIWLLEVDGTGFEPLETSGAALTNPIWTADGKIIYVNSESGSGDLWIRDPHPDSTSRSLITSPSYLANGRVSPDGMVLSYLSIGDINDPATSSVMVQDYRDLSIPARRLAVGTAQRWSPDGRRLYWRSGGSMMQWTVPDDLSGVLGSPTALFEVGGLDLHDTRVFAIGPNNERFLMNFKTSESSELTILVQNWIRLLDE